MKVLLSVVQVLRHGAALSGRGAHHGGHGDGGPDRVQVQYSTVQYSTVQTVCSMNKPFKISVHSDALEYADTTTASEGTLANNRGFSISESLRYFAAEAASLNCNFFSRLLPENNLSHATKCIIK